MKIYLTTNTPTLEDFVGQPIWVKVTDTEYGYDWFIKIVSITGQSAIYYEMPDYFLESFPDYANDLLQGIETHIKSGSISHYKVVSPLQIYTDDDVKDCLYND